MFRFLARSALATVIWKRYRRPIGSTLALFISYFFIVMVHGDYISWATTTAEHKHLWASFVIKWLALIGVTLLYYWFNTRTWTADDPAAEVKPKSKRAARRQRAPQPDASEPDPFASIRSKDKLRSRADLALEQAIKNRPPP